MGRQITPQQLLKRIAKKAPCVARAIQFQKNDWLARIEGWVQQCWQPDTDFEALRAEISVQFGDVFGIRAKPKEDAEPDPKGIFWNMDVLREVMRQSNESTVAIYVECCQDLATYPEKTVAAAFKILRRRWAALCTAEDQATMMEKPLCKWFRSLDDRTRYVATTLMNMLGREALLKFLDEICRDTMEDYGFLEDKADEFRDDPQLGILVRMNDLLAEVDAGNRRSLVPA